MNNKRGYKNLKNKKKINNLKNKKKSKKKLKF